MKLDVGLRDSSFYQNCHITEKLSNIHFSLFERVYILKQTFQIFFWKSFFQVFQKTFNNINIHNTLKN